MAFFTAAGEHHSFNAYGTAPPAAPPPTPSNHTNLSIRPSSASSSAFSPTDPFSNFLQLSASLSLSLSVPNNSTASFATAETSPIISLRGSSSSLKRDCLSAAEDHGFFQLIDHNICPQTAHAAHLHSVALLRQNHPNIGDSHDWPVGLVDDDGGDNEKQEEDDGGAREDHRTICFDVASSDGVQAAFLEALGAVGHRVMEMLGFQKTAEEGDSHLTHLVWVSNKTAINKKKKTEVSSRLYPYVISLQYQMHSRSCLLWRRSGWVSLKPQVDAVLVTTGDIAQVWSNGRFLNVIGRPEYKSSDTESHCCFPMTMLVTWLPCIQRTVSPLPQFHAGDDEGENDAVDGKPTYKKFMPFSFQEYACRVYNQSRLLLKDPLDRYRI